MGKVDPSVGRCVATLAALAILAVGCTTGGTSSATPLASAGPTVAQFAATTLVVAQFNTDISDEWPNIDVEKVAEAIRASGADVVGVEEGGASIPCLPPILAGATTTFGCRSCPNFP
jgi:hypothetical protein